MTTHPIPVFWGDEQYPSTNAVAKSCGGSAGAVRKALAKGGKYRGKYVRHASVFKECRKPTP